MMAIGSVSFVGIGMLAAILPLLYVERGAQMTFVLQSVLLLVTRVYYPISILPDWMPRLGPPLTGDVHPRRGPGRPSSRAWAWTELLGDVWPLVVMAIVLIPVGVWGFGRAEAYAKRTGKLKRVG